MKKNTLGIKQLNVICEQRRIQFSNGSQGKLTDTLFYFSDYSVVVSISFMTQKAYEY